MNYQYSKPLRAKNVDDWLILLDKWGVGRICFKERKIVRYPDMYKSYVFRIPRAEGEKFSSNLHVRDNIFAYYRADNLYNMHEAFKGGKWMPISVWEVVNG